MATQEQNTRLDSWKEIADYLGRDLSTVRRWERDKGLPVHRVPGGKRQAIFAYSGEIDRWLSGPDGKEHWTVQLAPANGNDPERMEEDQRKNLGGPRLETASPQPLAIDLRRMAAMVAAVTALAAALAFSLWMRAPLPPPKVLDYVQITRDTRPKFGPILTDGSRLYFREIVEGQSASVQVSIAGGEIASISTLIPHFVIMDISPDRSRLLVSTVDLLAEAPLWVLPIPAGPPRRLGELVGHDGTWSPNGEKIVYANGQDLYLAKSDGMESHKLVSLGGRSSRPRWSPDGSVLRFTIREPKTGVDSLWEVSADGTHLHPLLPVSKDRPAECCGNWTPDGRYYVYQSIRAGRTEIWALGEKGSLFRRTSKEPVRLTEGRLDNQEPVPSPDGKKLFVLTRLGRGELARYDSKSRQFLPYLSGISADGLAFSRDGKWVTYHSVSDHTLWRSRVDGSERLQLSFPPLIALLPSWSPDGTQIAFMGKLPGKPWKIHLTSAEGSGLHEMAPGNDDQANPTWSPDGNWLAFAGAPWVKEFSPNSTPIYLVDLRTHQVSRVPESEGFWSPRWSPDGRYIVATPTDSQKLVVFDFKTRKWSELAKLSIAYTCWSHDGKYIYLSTFPIDDPAIYRVRLPERKLERMISLKGIAQEWTLGPWFGLAPDDSLMVLRSTGINEIYALDLQLP